MFWVAFAHPFFRPGFNSLCATIYYFLAFEVKLFARILFFYIHYCCLLFSLFIFTAWLLSWTLNCLLISFKRKVLSCLIINWNFLWLICLLIIAYYIHLCHSRYLLQEFQLSLISCVVLRLFLLLEIGCWLMDKAVDPGNKFSFSRFWMNLLWFALIVFLISL